MILPFLASTPQPCLINLRSDIATLVKQLEGKSLRRVPADVSMKQPHARVILRESNYKRVTFWEHGNISPRRVRRY
jgi:hypothetical protein